MNKTIAILGATLALSLGSLSATHGQGQMTDQLAISYMDLDQPPGGYPGYPTTGMIDFHFQHGSNNSIVPGAVKIDVLMVQGTHLDSTISAVPTGWVYHYVNPINAYFTNTDTIPPQTSLLPGGVMYLGADFSVPFHIDTMQDGSNEIVINPTFISPWYHQPADGSASSNIMVAATPLPVDFASFDAKAAGCAVALNWVTSREENNDYFVVERSQDGRYFAKVGSVKALSGEDVGNREYSFVDEHPFQGNNFYRIRQMDINGKSTTTSVEKVQLSCDFNGDIAIYPNPTRGIVYVKGLADAESIEVFNVLGQRVLTQKIKQGTEVLDISNLADGNYHLRVIRNQESIFSAKIVKK